MPFYYYGEWVDKNCDKMPELTKFLKTLKNKQLVLLSVLPPNTRLDEHKGYSSHCNNVLRCHYGLIVPDMCYVTVRNDDEIIGSSKLHKKHEWLIFDDSKFHTATNNSDQCRIVLIIDMKRPKYIHNGTSDVEDIKELLEIVEYFKNDKEKIDKQINRY